MGTAVRSDGFRPVLSTQGSNGTEPRGGVWFAKVWAKQQKYVVLRTRPNEFDSLLKDWAIVETNPAKGILRFQFHSIKVPGAYRVRKFFAYRQIAVDRAVADFGKLHMSKRLRSKREGDCLLVWNQVDVSGWSE